MKRGSATKQQQSTAHSGPLTEDETSRRRRVAEEAKAAALFAAKQKEEESLRDAGRRAAAMARQIEMDAARLEAELERVSKSKRGKKGHKPLSGLRRVPSQATAPAPVGGADAPSPLPLSGSNYPQPVRSHDVRSFDFLPRIGRDLDF